MELWVVWEVLRFSLLLLLLGGEEVRTTPTPFKPKTL